eukprot:2120182-Alexandrium_andersonii.AAC.1
MGWLPDLLHNVSCRGVHLGTFYSGMLTPEVAMAALKAAVEKNGYKCQMAHARACDNAPGP